MPLNSEPCNHAYLTDIFCTYQSIIPQEEGYIAAILVSDGAQDVKVGMPVIVLVDDASTIPAFKSYKADAAPSSGAAAAPAPAAKKPAAHTASAPQAAPASHAPQSAPRPAGSKVEF
jgi:pyruvate/2-oxoglutarate dehydrogenase complex dihydrolipoamide acyltransferase (E2) component